MTTIETLEQVKELRNAMLKVIDRNFETAQRSDREGDTIQANLIRIMTDSIKEDADALEQIIDIAGYLKQNQADEEWYLTRPEPRNFETQIESLRYYRESAEVRKDGLIRTWNKKTMTAQIVL